MNARRANTRAREAMVDRWKDANRKYSDWEKLKRPIDCPESTLGQTTMASNFVLPGQPIPVPRGAPVPQLGSGIYARDSELRASLVGIPHQEGPVRAIFFNFTRLLITQTRFCLFRACGRNLPQSTLLSWGPLFACLPCRRLSRYPSSMACHYLPAKSLLG